MSFIELQKGIIIKYFFYSDMRMETPITPTSSFPAVTLSFNSSIVSSLSFVTESK